MWIFCKIFNFDTESGGVLHIICLVFLSSTSSYRTMNIVCPSVESYASLKPMDTTTVFLMLGTSNVLKFVVHRIFPFWVSLIKNSPPSFDNNLLLLYWTELLVTTAHEQLGPGLQFSSIRCLPQYDSSSFESQDLADLSLRYRSIVFVVDLWAFVLPAVKNQSRKGFELTTYCFEDERTDHYVTQTHNNSLIITHTLKVTFS